MLLFEWRGIEWIDIMQGKIKLELKHIMHKIEYNLQLKIENNETKLYNIWISDFLTKILNAQNNLKNRSCIYNKLYDERWCIITLST